MKSWNVLGTHSIRPYNVEMVKSVEMIMNRHIEDIKDVYGRGVFTYWCIMTFLVPKFTLQNYTTIMGQDFQWIWTDRWSFADLVRLLCVASFRERFADLDARKLATDLQVGNSETILLWGKSIKLKDCIIAIKLCLPSLWVCDYFFWNIWDGTHTGIDIIMPKWTPIPAFQWGKVTRIKQRDGVANNEGNCVVVQDARGYFRWYEHLHRIDVQTGQQLAQWTQIWICGTTWNSTQFHLHLQVDGPQTTPNPHWSTDIWTIQQKTIDPLSALRAAFSSIKDLPYIGLYQDAIWLLLAWWYIQWANWFIFPDNSLQRYEIALLLHRMLKKLNQYAKLTKVTTTSPTYSDVVWGEPELDEALLWLWQYGLMKWYPNGKFWPFEPILFEQLLALVGRSFFKLQDASGASWWQTYLTYFQNNGYLSWVIGKIGKSILRKDCFLLLSRVIK